MLKILTHTYSKASWRDELLVNLRVRSLADLEIFNF